MPAVLIGVSLLLLLAAFSAYGTSALQHSQSKGIVGWLVAQAGRIPVIGGFSVDQILQLDRWITHQIGSHFKQVEGQAIAWIGGLSTYVKVMAVAPMNVAAASWSLGWWLIHSEIPRIARAHTKHAEQTATHADAVAEAAMKAASGVAKSHPGKVTSVQVTRTERVAIPHAGEWTWINHHWKALVAAVTIPAALPGVVALPEARKWYGWTRRQLRFHNRRIARLEKMIGVTAFAAVLARTLGVSARCVRPGGNVGKVARALCGAPTRFLNDLLGILADVWLLENVCVVLPFLETAASDIGTPLVEGLTVVGAGICKGSAAPGALHGPNASLPNNSLGVLVLT